MIARIILFLFCFIEGVSSIYAASNCPSNEELRFKDGTSACASEYKFFTIKRTNAREGLLKKLPSNEAGPRMPHFSIAINRNLAQCPTSWVAWLGGGSNYPTSRFALEECEQKTKEQAKKSGINFAACGCEVLYEASSNGPNVPLAKKDFEEKVKAWAAFVQDQESFKEQYSKEEYEANNKFFADYKSRFRGSSDSIAQSINGQTLTQSLVTTNSEESCNFKTKIQYLDGTNGCLTDSPYASKIPEGEKKNIVELASYAQRYALAQSITPNCMAYGFVVNNDQGLGLGNREAQVVSQVKKEAYEACKKQGCECEVAIYKGKALISKQAILGNKTLVAGSNQSIQIGANTVGLSSLSPDVQNNTYSSTRLQADTSKEQKLAEDKRIKEELAKVAQQEKEQKELALKQKREAELQVQAEKERKLAEEKRLQMELAEKLRVEKEQKLAEDKRIKEELAKVAQQEKEQKELALKQKREAELQAIAAAQAEKYTFPGKKLALVIGNAKYVVHPLDNPKNDADDISRALKNVGFEVIDVRDATLSQMRSAIRSFGDRLLTNDVGLVYYSGHGIEVKGRNYFIPVNADIKRSDEIADQSIDVGLILDKMETAQKPVNILIVDACRDDPFGRSFRSGSRGLATMDAPQGTIIAFATSPGKVAADGNGRNSPYTKNLVLAMQEPNVPIEQVFKKVRRAVQQETKNQQTPWENTSLSGDFYFKVQR